MYTLLKSDAYRLVRSVSTWLILAIVVLGLAYGGYCDARDARTVIGKLERGEIAVEPMLDDGSYTERYIGISANGDSEHYGTVTYEDEEGNSLGVSFMPFDDEDTTYQPRISLSGPSLRKDLSPTWIAGEYLADEGVVTLLIAVLGVIVASCDLTGGYATSILSAKRNRWLYYAEKLLFLALVVLAFLLVGFAVAVGSRMLFGFGFALDPLPQALAWFALLWLSATGFTWLMAAIVWLSGSQAVGLVVTMLVCSGIVDLIISTRASDLANETGWRWLSELTYYLPSITQRYLINLQTVFGTSASLFGLSRAAAPSPLVHVLVGSLTPCAIAAALTFGITRRLDVVTAPDGSRTFSLRALIIAAGAILALTLLISLLTL